MTLDLFNFQHLILFKLFFFPTIILLITLIEKKFGPVIGGALSGLPLVSGALLCFAVLNKSYDEYYPSILGALEGVLGLSVMMFVYSKLTHLKSNGVNFKLSTKKIINIYIISLLSYFLVIFFISNIQQNLNNVISYNQNIVFILIFFSLILNFSLYKKLPQIVPLENLIKFKTLKLILISIIGTIVFLIFSSLKSYGSYSAIIGLISTAPIYLSIILMLTHLSSTDYDTLHLIKGIMIGFFGYIIYYSTFIIGIGVFKMNETIIVIFALLITLISFIIYSTLFKKNNREEITKMSLGHIHKPVPGLESDSFKEKLNELIKPKI